MPKVLTEGQLKGKNKMLADLEKIISKYYICNCASLCDINRYEILFAVTTILNTIYLFVVEIFKISIKTLWPLIPSRI